MAKAPDNLHVVIIAGGVGSRLWPKSRKNLPKQFFHIEGGESLARITYNRLKGYIPNDRIYIAAPKHYKSLIKKELPQIPEKNYIFDPKKQGTTAINLLSAAIIHARDPQAIVHLLVADDHLKDTHRFQKTSLVAALAAQDNSIVVFGIKPRFANTGLGYIKVSNLLEKSGKVETFKAAKFIEKPDEKAARRYLKSKKYYWHGSGFSARAINILDGISKLPGHKQLVEKIKNHTASGKPTNSSYFINLYSKITKEPIEKTFLEKSRSIKMVTVEDSWNDVGSWLQVHEIFPKDSNNNVILGDETKIVLRNCYHNIIFSNGSLIALTDLHGMVIIDTDDALLICPMANAQNVKKIVEILEEKKLEQYL